LAQIAPEPDLTHGIASTSRSTVSPKGRVKFDLAIFAHYGLIFKKHSVLLNNSALM